MGKRAWLSFQFFKKILEGGKGAWGVGFLKFF
jgi:hypothetical protein